MSQNKAMGTRLFILLYLFAATLASEAKDFHCRQQKAQDFLIRQNIEDASHPQKALEQAIRYRAYHYGSVRGRSYPSKTKRASKYNARRTTFFGIGLYMNKQVIPALKCVEREIQKSCNKTQKDKYTPREVIGLRLKNTYHNGEISNHLFGTAIDLDPTQNPCCGCVGKWQEHPSCQEDMSALERTKFSTCWIETFERYGFYWLGRDEMEDTMHFEFLGDPEKILISKEEAAAQAAQIAQLAREPEIKHCH